MRKEEKNNKEAGANLKDLKKDLELCQKQRDEYLSGWRRAKADYLNYKKEEMDRFEKMVNFANEKFILGILPVLDSFDISRKQMPEELLKNEYVKGLFQTESQLQNFLKNNGVEEIDFSEGMFDPNFQEAVEEVEGTGKESGIVIEEVKKGYKLHGKVIRPTAVKVAK